MIKKISNTQKLWKHLMGLNMVQLKVASENMAKGLINAEKKIEQDREERIVDEAYNTGFENGRKFERKDIARILSEKDE